MGSSSFGGQCLYGSSSGEGEVDGRYGLAELAGQVACEDTCRTRDNRTLLKYRFRYRNKKTGRNSNFVRSFQNTMIGQINDYLLRKISPLPK